MGNGCTFKVGSFVRIVFDPVLNPTRVWGVFLSFIE